MIAAAVPEAHGKQSLRLAGPQGYNHDKFIFAETLDCRGDGKEQTQGS